MPVVKKLTDICLPKQWNTVSLSELSNDGYPCYGANGIIGKYKEYNHESATVMIGCRGSCGNVLISEPKSYINGNAMCLENIDSSVLPKYLYYYLKSCNFSKIITGTSQPQITRNGLSKLDVLIYDIETQNEIISILDCLEDLINKTNRCIKLYDNLVKSQFIEMFGDIITNDRHWEVCALSRVAPIQPFSGTIPPSSDNRFWLLNLDMVESNSGEIVSYNMVDKNDIGNSVVMFDETNILYSKLRPYLNKVVIPDAKGYATSELVPLKPNVDKLNRVFLAYLLRSKEFVSYISGKVQGAKMPRVDLKYLKDFNLICPPLNVQNSFAIFINQIDKSKFRLKELQSKLENLYKSLLQKYFG